MISIVFGSLMGPPWWWAEGHFPFRVIKNTCLKTGEVSWSCIIIFNNFSTRQVQIAFRKVAVSYSWNRHLSRFLHLDKNSWISFCLILGLEQPNRCANSRHCWCHKGLYLKPNWKNRNYTSNCYEWCQAWNADITAFINTWEHSIVYCNSRDIGIDNLY